MQTLWFWIVAVMVAVYVVLDGFDFGAGILHLLVAKNDEERRTVFAAIGPLWDGNEVWLLAGGGVMFFAFPKVYAAGFSGFYLPLMMVLWLLILRGISIEFRSLEEASMWRSFWDGVFFLSSTLMAIVLGAALGNVIRGVPLGPDGYFRGPLFTNFLTGSEPGVLDWYTVVVGVFALCVLAMHGALFLWYKTTGSVQERSRSLAQRLWLAVVVVGVLVTVATQVVRPALFANLVGRPLTWILAVGVAVGIAGVPVMLKRGEELKAFLSSAVFITCLLAATAAGAFPTMLASTLSPAYSLTVTNSSAGSLSLNVGLFWWVLAIVLAVFYFVMLFRSFKGKVDLSVEGYGH